MKQLKENNAGTETAETTKLTDRSVAKSKIVKSIRNTMIIGLPLTTVLSGVLAIGFAVSFVVAYGAVAWFMAWVRKRGFTPFAIYRIILGAAVLYFAGRLAG